MDTCQVHKKYPNITCSNPALQRDPDRCCILHSCDNEKDLATFKEALRDRWNREYSASQDFRGIFFTAPFDPDSFLGSRELNKATDFSWATFNRGADFRDVTFAKNANFFDVTFIGVDFYRAAFMEWAGFDKATFKDRADFKQVTFTKKAYFSGTTFEDEANFSFATFKKEADFFEASFTKKASFSMAAFEDEADFSMDTFTGEGIFSKAIFAGKAAFFGTTFSEKADFSGTRMEGRIVFQGLNLPKEGGRSPAFQGTFRYLELSPEAVLRFQDLSLGEVKFGGTDLRRVEFHHVQWHPFRGRQVIYDEILSRKEEKEDNWLLRYTPYADLPESLKNDYGEVERLYRDLQENYEKARDYKKMGDFHYGEMEMHRLASKWRWCPVYFYNLYWFLSGYGERPSRALGWLAVFLSIFTGLLAWAGLKITDSKHIQSFGDSFFYLLQKVTLQRPTWAEPQGFWGKLAAGFSVLFIPGQAALFLLALRNRLGRRR